jgi:hypothetical protein
MQIITIILKSSFDLGKIKEFVSPEQMAQLTEHMQEFINSLGW